MNDFINDPLFNTDNVYNKAKQNFIENYSVRTSYVKDIESEIEFEHDFEFQRWEKEEHIKLNNLLLQLIAELNQNNTFYVGCPLSVYIHNYNFRLTEFQSKYKDVTELDFINEEIMYLENTLHDIENKKLSEAGFAKTGIGNFNFVCEIVNELGYKQFKYSTDKKTKYLKGRLQSKLSLQSDTIAVKPEIIQSMSKNLIIPPKDFPTEKYLEMTGICASINQKTSDLFCFYHQTSFLRGSDNQWQNDTKLKIEQLISKFSNNKLLLDSLSIGIKGIKDHIISQVDKYNESTFTYPKIDVFPLLNFINEKLDDLNKKIEKELTIKDNESISLEPAKNEIEDLSSKQTKKIKYKAAIHVLAFMFDCHAKGESPPFGKKSKLEEIGNERIGANKGNRFYKVFLEICYKDLNVETKLIEIGGEDWREAVIKLSKYPELVESYLQRKQL